MKRVIQNVRTGQLRVADVPPPALAGPGALVRNVASVVSAGTEKMVLEFASKGMLSKARARPDLVRQVLEKVKRDGLLPTVKAVMTRLDEPMPLGYSSSGTVLAVSPDCMHVAVGDAVACAGAGYASHAELVYVPKNLLVKVPEGVGFEQAAFGTLGAIAMQGVRVADLRLGERVAVIGLGLLGLITVQLVKACGCEVVGSDPSPQRRELAGRLGADAVVSPAELASEVSRRTAGRGADAVIVTAASSSNEIIEQAGLISRLNGRISMVGAVKMDIPRKIFYERQLQLRLSTSYGPGRYDPQYEQKGCDYPYAYVPFTEQRNIECFLSLLAAGKVSVDELITHRFSIDQAEQAYKLVRGEVSEPYIGIVLTYPQQGAAPEPKVRIEPRRHVLRPLGAGRAVRVGVVGAGLFASSVHIPNIARMEGVEPIAVASIDGVGAEHAARKHGFRYASSSARQLFEDSDIDAVIIATRHGTHAELAAAALKAGKHVFVEKPLAVTQEQLAELVETANNSEKLLMVGYNRRFAPLSVRVKNLLSDRRVPLSINYVVNAGRIPLEHWTQDPVEGGGRLIGEGCHFIDWMGWLCGGLPTHVVARCTRSDNPDVVDRDNVFVTVSFSDGSVGCLAYLCDGDKSHTKEHIEVFGGGIVIIDDFRRGRRIHRGRSSSLSGKSKGHYEEMLAFFDAIRRGGDSPIPLHEAVAVTLATFAAVDSLNTGQLIELCS